MNHKLACQIKHTHTHTQNPLRKNTVFQPRVTDEQPSVKNVSHTVPYNYKPGKLGGFLTNTTGEVNCKPACLSEIIAGRSGPFHHTIIRENWDWEVDGKEQ